MLQSIDKARYMFVERLLAHSALSFDEQNAILTLPGNIVEIRAHRDYLYPNQSIDHASILCDGLAGRFGQSDNGKRQIVALHIPGDMPDMSALMLQTRSYGIEALSTLRMLRISHKAMRDAMAAFPRLMQAMWRNCLIDASIGQQWLLNVGRRDARTRLAHLLCEMAERYRRTGEALVAPIRFELPATQQHLADMLGLTPVHINRTLQGLRSERLVRVVRSSIDIIDWNGLCAAGEFDPAYLHLGKPAPIVAKPQIPSLPLAAGVGR